MTNVAVSPSTLAPNASGTLTQNYTITQADINAGTVTNSAIGSATDPSNVTVSDTSGTTTTNDTATVTTVPKTSSVALVKTAVYNGNATAAQVGDTITYTFTITNTGNTTLSNAVVSDAKLGMTNVAVSPSTLAPNASGTLTQNYTITQADINAGTVTNSAIGSATDPSNATVSDTSGTTTTNDTATVTTVPKTSSVALVKTAVYNGNATAAQVGDTITYTFTITNTGNTTLTNAVVTDAKLGMTNVAVSPSTLAPNASGTLTQNYTITQADINAGTCYEFGNRKRDRSIKCYCFRYFGNNNYERYADSNYSSICAKYIKRSFGENSRLQWQCDSCTSWRYDYVYLYHHQHRQYNFKQCSCKRC